MKLITLIAALLLTLGAKAQTPLPPDTMKVPQQDRSTLPDNNDVPSNPPTPNYNNVPGTGGSNTRDQQVPEPPTNPTGPITPNQPTLPNTPGGTPPNKN